MCLVDYKVHYPILFAYIRYIYYIIGIQVDSNVLASHFQEDHQIRNVRF